MLKRLTFYLFWVGFIFDSNAKCGSLGNIILRPSNSDQKIIRLGVDIEEISNTIYQYAKLEKPTKSTASLHIWLQFYKKFDSINAMPHLLKQGFLLARDNYEKLYKEQGRLDVENEMFPENSIFTIELNMDTGALHNFATLVSNWDMFENTAQAIPNILSSKIQTLGHSLTLTNDSIFIELKRLVSTGSMFKKENSLNFCKSIQSIMLSLLESDQVYIISEIRDNRVEQRIMRSFSGLTPFYCDIDTRKRVMYSRLDRLFGNS